MSDEEPTQYRKLRPHPPNASPKESARKGFRHADRRRSAESSSKRSEESYHHSSDSLRQVRSYRENHYEHENGKQGSNGTYHGSELGHKPAFSSRDNSPHSQTLFALEAELRVLSLENATYRTRNQELLEKLEKAHSLNAHLEAKLDLEAGESQQLQALQAAQNELREQLQQAKHTIQELQQIESMLKQELEDQARDNVEKQKALNRKLSSMELVQQQVVMENSRLHSEIRKERTLRQNCEVHLRSHNQNTTSNHNAIAAKSPRFSRNSDSFLSPDTSGRSRDKGRSPLRTAGKPSSPSLHQPAQRDPPPRLEGVIHLDNRGRTNQQTFDLFKPLEGESFPSPRSHPHPSTHWSVAGGGPGSSRKLRPSPLHDSRFRGPARDLTSPFAHERDADPRNSRSMSVHLSPPYATNGDRASELALARLEKRLLALHQEKQDREDERTKLERARETVLGRKRKAELDTILARLKVDITNVKTAIRRLGLS